MGPMYARIRGSKDSLWVVDGVKLRFAILVARVKIVTKFLK